MSSNVLSDPGSNEFRPYGLPRIDSNRQTSEQTNINMSHNRMNVPHDTSAANSSLTPLIDNNNNNTNSSHGDHDTNHNNSNNNNNIPRSELMSQESDNDINWGQSATQIASTSLAKRSKTKYAKIFQCTGYGDCRMTFTRSEHLARHIRKHTGERPFKCVCTRTFSRLDNLRQHIHTVHANDSARFPMNYPLVGMSVSTTAAPTHSAKVRISPKGGSSPVNQVNDQFNRDTNLTSHYINNSNNIDDNNNINPDTYMRPLDSHNAVPEKIANDNKLLEPLPISADPFPLRPNSGSLLRKSRPSPILLNNDSPSISANESQELNNTLASPLVSPINRNYGDSQITTPTGGQHHNLSGDMSVNFKFPPISPFPLTNSTISPYNQSPFSPNFPTTNQLNPRSSHHHHLSYPISSYRVPHRNISADFINGTISSRSVYSQAFPPTTPFDSPLASGGLSPTTNSIGHGIMAHNGNNCNNNHGYNMDSNCNSSSPFNNNILSPKYSSGPMIKTRSVSASASFSGSEPSLFNSNPVLPRPTSNEIISDSFSNVNTNYQSEFNSAPTYSSISRIRMPDSSDYDQSDKGYGYLNPQQQQPQLQQQQRQQQQQQQQLSNDDDLPRRPKLFVNKSYTRNFILPPPEICPPPTGPQPDTTLASTESALHQSSTSSLGSSSVSSASSGSSSSSSSASASSGSISSTGSSISGPVLTPHSCCETTGPSGVSSNVSDVVMTEDRPDAEAQGKELHSVLPIDSQMRVSNEYNHQNQFDEELGSKDNSQKAPPDVLIKDSTGNNTAILEKKNNSTEMGGMEVLLEAAGL